MTNVTDFVENLTTFVVIIAKQSEKTSGFKDLLRNSVGAMDFNNIIKFDAQKDRYSELIWDSKSNAIDAKWVDAKTLIFDANGDAQKVIKKLISTAITEFDTYIEVITVSKNAVKKIRIKSIEKGEAIIETVPSDSEEVAKILSKRKMKYFVNPDYAFKITECFFERNAMQGIILRNAETGTLFCVANDLRENLFDNYTLAEKYQNKKQDERLERYKSQMPDLSSSLKFVYTHDIQSNEIAKRAFKERVDELCGVRLK